MAPRVSFCVFISRRTGGRSRRSQTMVSKSACSSQAQKQDESAAALCCKYLRFFVGVIRPPWYSHHASSSNKIVLPRIYGLLDSTYHTPLIAARELSIRTVDMLHSVLLEEGRELVVITILKLAMFPDGITFLGGAGHTQRTSQAHR